MVVLTIGPAEPTEESAEPPNGGSAESRPRVGGEPPRGVGRTWPDFGPPSVLFWRIPYRSGPTSGQIWSDSDQSLSMHGQICPSWANSGQSFPWFATHQLAWACRRPYNRNGGGAGVGVSEAIKSCPCMPQLRGAISRMAESGQNRAKVATTGAKFGRMLAKFGRHSGPSWVELGQSRAIF